MSVVFERWQCRAIHERAELRERLSKLRVFLLELPKPVDDEDLQLLRDQEMRMRQYLAVLNLRIKKFGGPP